MLIHVLFSSCTSEKPATTTTQKGLTVETRSVPAVGYRLEITPEDPTRNSVLVLTPKGFNLSEARIIWMVNNMVDTGASTDQYRVSGAAKGDVIQAKAVLRNTEILSNSLTIRNAPPAISQVKFIPAIYKQGDRLGVEPTGTDIDGDAVTFLYEWTLNGEPAGNEQSLNSTLKRGDRIVVKITPFDGEAYGVPVVLERGIDNTPPVIIENKEYTFDGSVYTYQVRASDPDGDTLTYSLESPPEGMTINPSTGLMRWVVPAGFKGKKDVSIIVRDGHGGSASYSIAITIQE